VLGGEPDRESDVVDHCAARDRRRALVDHAVPHPARGLVLGVLRRDQLAGEPSAQRVEGVEADGGDGLDGHGCSFGRVAATIPSARKATVRTA
jgi:hypothetical protein